MKNLAPIDESTDVPTRANSDTKATIPTKTTDANGWTVYNNGVWIEYRKRVTYSQSIANGGSANLTLSPNNLPSGMSSLGTNFISGTAGGSGFAFGLQWNFEMTSSSTALNVTAYNVSSTRTYSGFIDVTITG